MRPADRAEPRAVDEGQRLEVLGGREHVRCPSAAREGRGIGAHSLEPAAREAVQHQGDVPLGLQPLRPRQRVRLDARASVQEHEGGEWPGAGRLVDVAGQGRWARERNGDLLGNDPPAAAAGQDDEPAGERGSKQAARDHRATPHGPSCVSRKGFTCFSESSCALRLYSTVAPFPPRAAAT